MSLIDLDAGKPLVRCIEVGRTFGRGTAAVRALSDVTCEVHPGQLLALSGPSGSGKSTLLHLMAGLDAPTLGTVEWPAIGGNALRPGPIGMVFQGPSLLPPLNVIENIALPLVLAGMDQLRADAAARIALDRMDLADIANKLPEELSGGQSQRVAVARVLVGDPYLILADEPTGQLDHEHAALVTDALIDAAVGLGAALVVSTHDPKVAGRFPDLWRMAGGRLLQPSRKG